MVMRKKACSSRVERRSSVRPWSACEASRSRGLVRIGDGRARFSHVYVDNVAHAHVLAARALSEGSRVSGRAYFVVDAPPQNFFDFVAPFLEQVGVERSSMRVPAWSARSLAWANEWLLRGFGRWLGREPGLTRYAVAATCVDFWFRHDRATADFGYHPIVPLEEAQRRTAEWFRVHARAGDRHRGTLGLGLEHRRQHHQL